VWRRSSTIGTESAQTGASFAGIVNAEGGGTTPHPRVGDQNSQDRGRRGDERLGGMRRVLSGGYELDDDPRRVDIAAVHRYLSEESYWAEGRSRETVERLVREAARVVGLYQGEAQVGFARAVSDGVALAYLADVYVLAEHRGFGLGKELVRELVDGGPYAGVRWLLHTRDAQDLYSHIGFGPPGEGLMERPARG
jgi:GNAT superfamily N-acetyltransferase